MTDFFQVQEFRLLLPGRSVWHNEDPNATLNLWDSGHGPNRLVTLNWGADAERFLLPLPPTLHWCLLITALDIDRHVCMITRHPWLSRTKPSNTHDELYLLIWLRPWVQYCARSAYAMSPRELEIQSHHEVSGGTKSVTHHLDWSVSLLCATYYVRDWNDFP